jgi:hypothetical protein
MAEHNIQPIKKGDTFTMTFSFWEDKCEGTKLDVSTYSFLLQARNSSGNLIFQWTNTDFVAIDNFTRRVTLSDTVTAAYTAGEFVYELQVTIGTDKYTWMEGYVQVLNQVAS